MPAPAKIALLPAEVRDELNRRLVQGGFGGLEALESWLEEQGFEIGKSSIGRHSQALKRKLAAIRASTDAAAAIAAAAPDDADLRSAATMSLVQTELFDVLVALQEAEEADDPKDRLKILASAGKTIAEISRASVNQKKWQAEVSAKAEAAAAAAEKIAKKGGLSAKAVDEIRRQILGIAK
jgi:hypothetical protein